SAKASSKKRRSSFSQRSDDALSGSRTAILPLSSPLPPPSVPSSPAAASSVPPSPVSSVSPPSPPPLSPHAVASSSNAASTASSVMERVVPLMASSLARASTAAARNGELGLAQHQCDGAAHLSAVAELAGDDRGVAGQRRHQGAAHLHAHLVEEDVPRPC